MATPYLSADPTLAIVFVSFRDVDGGEIDGSCGIDALAGGFLHGGRKVRLPSHLIAVLSSIAEHGGRWQEGRGFAFREEDVPDLLRAFRTLPPEQAPEESPEAQKLRIDARPISPTESAELTGHEVLERVTSFRDADGKRAISMRAVRDGHGRSWIRTGNAFYRRPVLTAAEIEEIAGTPSTTLTGDDVPYFLAKHLVEASKAGRSILLGPRASAAKVLNNEWLPSVNVDLEDDQIRFDVSFKTGEHRIPFQAARQARKRRYVPLDGDVWVRNDHDAQERVEHALREIPHRKDSKTGTCLAPAYALVALQETFAAIGTIDLTERAEALRDKLLDFTRIEPVPIPRRLKATLREYQRHGLNWLGFLRKYGLAGVLADDMGLGKTVQTLSAILAAHEAGQPEPSLVVCPASVTSVWAREVQKWCDGVNAVILTADNRQAFMKKFPRETVAVVSYASVARDPDAYSKRVWNYLVLDEAHRVKNHETATARACKELMARHKVAVTGTPIQNRLRDLWSVYDSIMPGHLGDTLGAFERTFGVPIEKEKDEAAASRLRKRIDPFKLRRLKTQVATDLPPLNQQVRTVQMLRTQQDMYDDLVREIVPQSIEMLRDPARRGGPFQALEKLLRLRQVCAHPRLLDPSIPLYGSSAKFEELRELVDESVEAGHRILIFTQWTQMASLICGHLSTSQIDYRMFDGATPVKTRAKLVEEFQTPDGPQILVVSLLAGGEGITLTEADTVIMYDRWWNPAVEEQALARAHRIGQKRPVTAYILETERSVEQRLAALLGTKKELAADLIEVDAAEKRITREDLLAVLQEELAAAGRGSWRDRA